MVASHRGICPTRLSERFRNLDQIAIRVAHVDGTDRTAATASLKRTGDDGYAALIEPVDDSVEWHRGEKTEVERSCARFAGLEVGIESGRMNVDFLVAEPQCKAIRTITLFGHAEHPRVKVDALTLVPGGEHDMVDRPDHIVTRS